MGMGEYIKKLREENNFSQEYVAEKISVDRSTLSKYERNVLKVPYDIIKELSKLYNVSITNIINCSDNDLGENNVIENLYTKEMETGKKYLKLKRATIVIFVILLILFLVYYFFNTYNSIQLYNLKTFDDNLKIENALLVTTKDKIYFNLGYIYFDKNIDEIELFYKINDEEILICKTNNNINNLFIIDYIDSNEYFEFDKINKIAENIYIKIYYGEEELVAKLDVATKDTNDKLFFREKSSTLNKELEIKTYKSNLEDKFNIDEEGNKYLQINYNKKIYKLFLLESELICVYKNESWRYNMETNVVIYSLKDNGFIYDITNNKEIQGKKDDEKVKEILDIYEYLKKI